MKKVICGAMVTSIGLVFSVIFIIYAMQNPGTYNDIGGLLGSLLASRMLIHLIISSAVMIFGLAYSFRSAYKKEM